MFSVMLSVHITSALLMGGLSLLVGQQLYAGEFRSMRNHVMRLSYLLALELVTGSIMAMTGAKGISFGDFCENIALYLSLTAIVFFLVWWKTRDVSMFGHTITPVFPALCLSTVTALGLL